MKYICFLCFILSTLFAWSPPQNLGIIGTDDRNAQACRMQIWWGYYTCMVWQNNTNENWDVFSRFNYLTTWTDTVRISIDVADDVNPSVAYDYSRDCYWCAWQNNSTGDWEVYVSSGDSENGWTSPYQLTINSVDDEMSSVYVNSDTVWVVSQDNLNIISAYYDGSTWSLPIPITTDSIYSNIHPKINGRHNHPFVVWERGGDIYYSEYFNGSWQLPQSITTDPNTDMNPDVSTYQFYGPPEGVHVVWQTDRDGNYEIYNTAYDTLDVHYRITYNDSADITPSPLAFIAVTEQGGLPLTAISTNRNGNYDIYYSWFGSYPEPLETTGSQDISPTTTGGGFNIWVLWQTDRNDDWDIYGSYEYVGGVEESYINDTIFASRLSVFPNPFKEMTDIRYEMESGQDSEASLCIYDISGRMVKNFNLQSAIFNLQSKMTWDGTDDDSQRLPQGIYFVQFKKQSDIFTEKVALIK